MSISREEKETLAKAKEIIKRELVDTGEIKIPGLGKFRISSVRAPVRVDTLLRRETARVRVVRFCPWSELKSAVRHATFEEKPEDVQRATCVEESQKPQKQEVPLRPSGKIDWL